MTTLTFYGRRPADVHTADEARDIAVEWQRIEQPKRMSYAKMAEWQDYFTEIVEKFPELAEEFEENGIL
jgi:hypothetical protein